MRISLIVAVAENGVIGRDGDLPWKMSTDLKTFRRITMGKPIIMGRKTFQSLGKPLDGRTNIVVTRDENFSAEGAVVVPSVDAALEAARTALVPRSVSDDLPATGDDPETIVIGGAEIYRATLPFADRIYLTEIHAKPEGDTYFPALDPIIWSEQSSERLATGPRDQFEATLKVYARRTELTSRAP